MDDVIILVDDNYQEVDPSIHSENGLSAYELAVKHGFVGSVEEWLESLKGEKGEPGTPGKDGKDGLNGLNGVDGVDGRDGKDGVDGVTPDMSNYYTKSEIDSTIGDIESLLEVI